MNATIGTMIGAARLNAATYEHVELDSRTTAAAVFVVVAASVAASIGIGVTNVSGLVGVTFGAMATWAVWVGLTYVIGTRILPESQTRATLGELFRTTGFSASPGILRVFGFIPGIGWAVFLIVTIWMLVAFVVAVRQALDYSGSLRAFLVCFLGWMIHGILFFAFVVTAL